MSKGSTKLKVLHDLFEENNIHPNLMEVTMPLLRPLKRMQERLRTTGISLISDIRW